MSDHSLESTMTGTLPAGDELKHCFDWQHFVFESTGEWIDRLTRLARRRLHNKILAEEAFNFAFDRISADNWDRLSGYSRQSSPGTFLISVFSNALEDFLRSRFGRPRPPVWLTRLGESWQCVYRMLCLERMEPETIVDWLCARGKRDPDQVRKIIAVVRSGICHCGQVQGDFSTAEFPGHQNDTQSSTETPDSILEEQELASLLGALAALLHSGDSSIPPDDSSNERFFSVSERIRQRWSNVEKELALTDQERLILRQVYQDGRRIAAVARALGLPEHQARRTCKRAVERLRNALKKAGIDSADLRGV